MNPDVIREVSAWFGFFAALLLVYRLFDWPLLSRLERALGITLLTVVVAQVYGSSRTIASGTPLRDDVVYAIFAGRVTVVALCLAWPWLRRAIIRA